VSFVVKIEGASTAKAAELELIPVEWKSIITRLAAYFHVEVSAFVRRTRRPDAAPGQRARADPAYTAFIAEPGS